MDTLRIIKDKVQVFSSLVPENGLSAVIRHLEIAESHHMRARSERDEDLFTDVVYRTNHAFEGILREAYTLLENNNPKNRRPYEIEQYLSENEVFRPRVMELFKNYRTQWRNPSTHDYQLSFNEQEAFLSILSVSSFVSILLDQMIEKAAFNSEKASAEQKAPEIREGIENVEAAPLLDRVAYSLASFAKELRQLGVDSPEPTESQIHGMLRAFINSVLPEVTIEVEPNLQDDSGMIRPDFLLTQNDERIIVEVYRYKKRMAKIEERRQNQMLRYLRAAKVSSGIIFMYPVGSKHPLQKLDVIQAELIDSDRMIVYVRPHPRNQE